ncbi:hypothetical protein VOLCADRAFT_99379 [Volvox carteri f. nagariensis]|uniref:Uncharacterized protein n=1 Tax=Volvox carteri f. nagariensis TaxID=3068 RepID=D8UHN7_VOLCA|nr:uncharacterized protein VOLCADRAFT_99379 [Volvox carteri f. nagariensis]EFJ40781.1 hypothetical protein VOLCADRAFT_99379 [Volvox carteri f. nagariensis]|eukprot:XP_002958156.1 hypothetical protein VOLCADRAFT_99379 [Volvox carteri f. nagariensis]
MSIIPPDVIGMFIMQSSNRSIGDGRLSPAAAVLPLSAATSFAESEEDQLRRLEEDILEAAAAAAASVVSGGGGGGGGGAVRSAAAALLRRGRHDRRWQQRILAVAAFKTEGMRRRLLEEDILSVAASVCSEAGSGSASGYYSLDEAPQQHQGHARRLTQFSSDGPGGAHGGVGCGRWSGPASAPARNRGVFTAEDEDVMNLIMEQSPSPSLVPSPSQEAAAF